MSEQDDVATLCANIASAVVGHGDLDAAIADLHRLPADLPARCRLAAGLVEAINRAGLMTDLTRLRELDRLLPVADGAGITTPEWIRSRTTAEVTSVMHRVAERELTDLDAAAARIDALSGGSDADPALKPLFDAAYTSLRFARSVQEGDPGAMARYPADIRQLLAGAPQDDPQVQALGELLTAYGELASANESGGDVPDAVRRIQLAVERLPPGELRAVAEDSSSMMSALLAAGAGGQLTVDQLGELRAQVARPGIADPEQALRHSGAAMAAMGLGQETDLGRVDMGLEHLREGLRVADPGDPQRVFHLSSLALGLFRRSELTNSSADLREARMLLVEARSLAVGPQHPQWQMINEMLADVSRLVGDDPDFHRSAVEGLRAHVWRVLVQQDPAGVAAAVRGASTDAVDTARRCLVAGDPASAVAALDAGRGLALFAATEVRALADRLAEAGDADLAERWRTAAAAHDPEQLPADLRREVLKVLTAHSSAAALLDAPGLERIQNALVETDADALVYLVPAATPITGYAVVVPAAGAPSYMALPNLTIENDPDIERHLHMLSRNAEPARGVAPEDASGIAGSVGALCSWAWGAAIGPLVESYLPRLPAPPTGRPHHVVLVPMGDLARVPWQAARRKDGTYAVELVAISQAASARMLCHSAELSPVPPSPVGLLVGDPDTTDPKTLRSARELDAARLEAFAIRRSLYRGARYVGRRPDGSVSPSGRGTSAEVLAWLADSDPAAGSWLHLACHGFVRTGAEPTAYLLLAGWEKLTAEELVERMARAPKRKIGLVVLAACRTGLSMSGYDEAYSLGTAFLAGGARSVLSTHWSVPDRTTSALMYMFHHFLRVEGRPAWAALREAQLWMLDPDRKVPQEMPAPLLEELDLTHLAEVVAWAGFVHWGR